MLCTHKTASSASLVLEICPQFNNSFLHQFSSISGGNCIISPSILIHFWWELYHKTAALEERILSISCQARYISTRVQELVAESSVCMEMAHFWIGEMTASYSANCCHSSCEGYFLANVSSTQGRFLYTSIAHLFLSSP